MDPFEFKDEDIQPTRNPVTIVMNVLTVLFLLSAVCIGVVFATIFINPYVPYNPFPPPTLPAVVSPPTATPTPRGVLPPTWTPTFTLEPTDTPEPTATDTPEPAATEIPAITITGESLILEGSETVETPEDENGLPFILQPGNPVATSNINHPELGCNWLGVAGQAIGLSNEPVTQLFVKLGGTLQGKPFDHITITGSAPSYGSAGYEFRLADSPADSNDTLWVQLYDQAMLPLSEQITFDTYDDCARNLILIYFNQVRE